MRPEAGAVRSVASLGGRVLAAATHAVASVRPAAKPLHPTGEVWTARLLRSGSSATTGVPWIDQPGEDDVSVRLSRAVGLPETLPDIHGLALRVPSPDGDADLLLATTGRRRITRFLLRPTRYAGRWMTTLLPYRTATGPLVLGAAAVGGLTFDLAWARPSGPWEVFGSLQLVAPGGDPDISFDPVRRQLPGLEQYAVVTRLREPAYARARHTRGDDAPT